MSFRLILFQNLLLWQKSNGLCSVLGEDKGVHMFYMVLELYAQLHDTRTITDKIFSMVGGGVTNPSVQVRSMCCIHSHAMFDCVHFKRKENKNNMWNIPKIMRFNAENSFFFRLKKILKSKTNAIHLLENVNNEKITVLLSFQKNKNAKKTPFSLSAFVSSNLRNVAISISCLFNSVVSKFSSQNDCSLLANVKSMNGIRQHKANSDKDLHFAWCVIEQMLRKLCEAI